MATDWERAAKPTLVWVRDEAFGFNWEVPHGDDPSEEIPDLTGDELNGELKRLLEAGLIEGRPQQTSGYFIWSGLHVTGAGLRVLGDWPPDPRVSDADDVLSFLLKGLADQTEDETEAKWYRRAAGAISRSGKRIVSDALKGEARRMGGDLGA